MMWNRVLVCTAAVLIAAASYAQDISGRTFHEKAAPLDVTKHGPYALDDAGNLLMIDGNVLMSSTDDGKTWAPISEPITTGMQIGTAGHPGHFIRTRAGGLVAAFLDFDGYVFKWDDAANKPLPECKLELHVIRSTDGGKTWADRQCLLPGYNADFMGFVQTRTGRLVLTVEHLDNETARWMVCSFVSDDEGKTWRRGNWIDLGGHGHHDGAVEPTVAELSDGRLLMLIRTSLDRFWSAISDNDGLYWREIKPTDLDASSAPGWLLRLADGKLMFVWNRLAPENGTVSRAQPGSASEVAMSWHRTELSIAFSSDDGRTWSTPVVVARHPGGQIAYPYLFERRPGEIWLISQYNFDKDGKTTPPVALKIMEKDFIGE